ncbi:cyclopropane-fatty-acyl-phospholipid synthase family protein [Salinicola sp. DM10]|uniref:SAM-dependent methyltransferase n=1 Tax=Salinicola sp. DM10 TaxID=2815721 RepID=UPI001A8CBACB|nr:cyclopropane-fatty-acyl-phospholipid synthase family protein [Salinicola sp. DM10]MCE3028826.1 cyclopropane-fatty-acyl-phospholipid synthase family protein [Salinicola sp. DM10]
MTTAPSSTVDRRRDAPRLSRWLRPRILKALDALDGGVITLHEGGQRHRLGRGDPAAADTLTLCVHVHSAVVWRRFALGGTVGVAESYMDGEWEVDDLVGLVRLFARNVERVNAGMENGTARFSRWALAALYALQRNTSTRARRHIAAHYDLGNALFATFLDRDHWMYSSAVFPHPAATLEEASTHKLDLILDKLAVEPHHHLLEIGTGWGGLAIHAARTRGCRVTTTTISEAQYAYTAERVREAGLESQITLLREDYRALTGRYDRLVSVEMVEAVGHQYLDTYLGCVDRLLTDDGLALLQCITIRDQRFEAAKREMDFIKRYIFPGGFLPSHTAILSALSRHTQLNLLDLDEIGLHYARTLREWRQRFEASLERVRELGYDERFIRMWRYYLCYCEGGFVERAIGTCHLLLAKPGARRAPLSGQP